MDKSISPDLEKRMHALCDDIASAEGLSAELHDELYAHIEDKMLGYLSGEDSLSEADAFVLAREHFGDRLAVREQLAEFHPISVPLMPRLKFLIVLLAFVLWLCSVSFKTRFFLPPSIAAIQHAGVFIGCVWLQFYLLRLSRERAAVGKDMWFQHWNIGVILFVLALSCLFWNMCKSLFYVWASNEIDLSTIYMGGSGLRLLGQVCIVASILAWLKHCDIQARPRWHLLMVVVVFAGVSTFIVFFSHIFNVQSIAVIEAHESKVLFQLDYKDYCIFISDYRYYNLPGKQAFPAMLTMGGATWLGYVIWTHLCGKMGKRDRLEFTK